MYIVLLCLGGVVEPTAVAIDQARCVNGAVANPRLQSFNKCPNCPSFFSKYHMKYCANMHMCISTWKHSCWLQV